MLRTRKSIGAYCSRIQEIHQMARNPSRPPFPTQRIAEIINTVTLCIQLWRTLVVNVTPTLASAKPKLTKIIVTTTNARVLSFPGGSVAASLPPIKERMLDKVRSTTCAGIDLVLVGENDSRGWGHAEDRVP